MKKSVPFLILMGLLVVADQVSKWLVSKKVMLHSTVPVVPGFFNITQIHNRGAIFGAFGRANNPVVYMLLTVASLTALALVIYYFIRTPATERGLKISLSLIMAGALGNLIDRVFRGYVIDWLDFYFRRWHWPFFNIADSCITIGAGLVFFFFLTRRTGCSPCSSA